MTQKQKQAAFRRLVRRARVELGITPYGLSVSLGHYPGWCTYLEEHRRTPLPPDQLTKLAVVLEFSAAEMLDVLGYFNWDEADRQYLAERLEAQKPNLRLVG